jgi:hypothetical protein
MVEETLETRPDAMWYIFIETDSYLFLPALVQWLKRFDSSKPLYMGPEINIDGTDFAHGGSRYVLSHAAMHKLLSLDQPRGLAASWDSRMQGLCRGDYALGVALKEKDVHLTVANPLINGYKPTTFIYSLDNRWCQHAVTMHHLLSHEVNNVWKYERISESFLGKGEAGCDNI